MVVVPFLFFTILTIYWWNDHKGFDICTYMSGLFAFTTMFAMLIVFSGDTQGTNGDDSGGMLWAGWEPILGVVPTILFCVLIGLAILPFSFVKTREIKNIENKAPWTLLLLSGFLIAVALVNLYCVADSTMDILSGDFAAIRDSANKGDQTPAELKAEGLPMFLGYLTYFNFSTTLALPIMFYNICFSHRPWWWNTLLFFTAMTPILAGMQRVDRTEPIYFSLMLVYCIVFFRHFFTRKVKIVLGSLVSLIAILGIVYIYAVSTARFDNRKNGGALVSVIQYTGQGYLNFCYFWENATFDRIDSEREFPLLNHYVANIDSDADRRAERSAHQGFFISVFPTFIGDIMLDLGPLGMILWVMGYAFIGIRIIRWKDRTEYDVSEILLLFFLGSIPLFGVFYYRYFAWMIALNYVILILFWIASRYKFVINYNEDTDSDCNV